jgi:DUF4097 and DUF4098 domain-containing protein YvlB
MNRKTCFLCILAASAASAFAGDSSRYKEDFHYSFNQGPGGHLDLQSFNGSIEITGWDQSTVDVSGTKYAEDESMLRAMRVTAVQEGNTVRVRTERPEPRKWNCGAKYIIRVPRRTDLQRIQSSNGSIRAEEIEGMADLTTSNGGIRLRNIRGHAEVRTSNGAVDVQSVDAGVNIRTSNGSVTIDNVRGSLQAATSNGAIRGTLADSTPNEPIKLSTSNGSIDIRIQMPRNNDITASTSNGSVTVRMPPGAGARLNATTSSHESISTDFDVQVHGILTKNRIEGTIGGGGPLLQLSTSNGAIRILKL